MNDKLGAMHGTASISVSCRATIGARFIGTGRQITANGDYQQVWQWSKCGSEDDLRRHPAHARFLDALEKASRVTDGVSCFRGRSLNSGTPTWEDMGPPPERQPGMKWGLLPVKSRPSAGRYNAEGCAVLYLSDSCDGVARELRKNLNGVWVQRYNIPCAALNIVNFGIDSADDFANIVFWWTETVGLKRCCPSGSVFSRFIADLVADRYDGMRVPSVRGADAKYHNIVMFRPHSGWRGWVERAARPVPIQDCVSNPEDS